MSCPLIFKPILIVLSIGYRWGLLFDRFRKRISRQTLPRPVISVGNLTWGGTGKTPILMWVVGILTKKSIQPAILTRGYGDDEIMLMKEKCPGALIGIGADRWDSANKILATKNPSVFVLDDGFQHWSLNRNLDLVCVDATDPWGGGHLIPWGRLRESVSGLSRAQAVILTRSSLVTDERRREIVAKIARWAPKAAVIECEFSLMLMDRLSRPASAKSIFGKKVVALSAIGNAGAFESDLKNMGATVISKQFRDHHLFTEADLNFVEELSIKEEADVVMTEKDWVKIRELSWGKGKSVSHAIYIAVLDVLFRADGQARLETLLTSVVH